MANSNQMQRYLDAGVVNCFQISNFVLWQTATDENFRVNIEL